MNDLVRYIDSGLHAPLIQAALTHAQFETIHPFADGNGRVGRALIHTVLTRRGLTPTVVLPISVVLLTRQDGYAEGLTAYRRDGPSSSTAATTALSAWVELFLDATATAVDQASRFAARVVSRSWDQLEDGEGAVHGPRRPAGCFGDVVSAGEP